MLEKLLVLLGESAEQYSTAELIMALEDAEIYILDYTNRDELNSALEYQKLKLAHYILNRKGTEGIASEGYSGISYTYTDIPKDITNVLDRNRLVKYYV